MDWEENPMQTLIDGAAISVEELKFPTITLCDPDSHIMLRRNRWMFLEWLFNAAKVKKTNNFMNKVNPGTLKLTMLIAYYCDMLLISSSI